MTIPSSDNRSIPKISGFPHPESGAAAVEFALVAAPLALVLFAIIEVSLMLAAQHQLQNATDAMSRQIKQGHVTARDGQLLMLEAEFRAGLCNRITLVRRCLDDVHIDVRNATRFSDLAREIPDPMAVGPQSSGEAYQSIYQPGGAARAGSLIVSYDWRFFGPLGMFGNLSGLPGARRISGIAIYKNESF